MDRFWYVADRRQAGWELKLPTTTAQIIVNLDADRLTTRLPDSGAGTRLATGRVGFAPIASTAVVLDRAEQRRTVGIVIRPEAIGTVADLPAEGLDVLVGLDTLWGPSVEGLAEVVPMTSPGPAVLDRVEVRLVHLLRHRRAPDPSCRTAIGHLRGGMAVARVAEEIGLSQSALTRRFRSAVGVTPKRFQRLLRMERAIQMIKAEAPEWAAVAARCGYHDQPHLTHEFGELTGLTPTQWQRSATGDPFHVELEADFLQDVQSLPTGEWSHGQS